MSTATLPETRTGTAKRQFCTFWVAGRLYGVDILDVKEINSENMFTPVFHASKEIKGYVNIRGHIHLIIDLRLLLGFESNEKAMSSRIVLFKPTVGESFGVFVDKIGDVVEVDQSEIEDFQGTDSHQSEEERLAGQDTLISGVCKLEGRLLVLLDASKFMATI